MATSTKQKSTVPNYDPGNSLYSTNESLTAQDIENYFRFGSARSSSSTNSTANSTSNISEPKIVQYLRPTSFEQQQKEVQQLNKNKLDIVPYAAFHEKKKLLAIGQKAYARDFQRKFDNEFLQHCSKDQTDLDDVPSEADKEEIRHVFGISHALETFDDYEDLKQWINQDTTLPVYSQKDKILSTIETNSITVIQGNTGSGKSTQIPQYILDDYVERSKPVNIVVTQPRHIAARSLCEHVSHSRNWTVGQTVGYQTSLNKQRCELTRILYCITGILLQKLILTKNLQDFTHIILDEVHERDQSMDFLLILVRMLWLRNSQNVKIILMSATIEIDKLTNYFRQVINGRIVPAY
ncbi:unnamed protein product [Rotaria socialis]|uniref:Helicase ATP-binding domain-containing protein n=1 Tax=Rotaria socialis TaxID=392032 RepID=A0A818GKI6_9BILA|nr:unnamed protein product [Rotaria socialis]CAF4613000.1 unnamed protein product [Rotaria socialis]